MTKSARNDGCRFCTKGLFFYSLFYFICARAISWSLWPQSIQRLNSSGKDVSSGLLLQGGVAGPEV